MRQILERGAGVGGWLWGRSHWPQWSNLLTRTPPPTENTPDRRWNQGKVRSHKAGAEWEGRDGSGRMQQREKPAVHNLIEGILSEWAEGWDSWEVKGRWRDLIGGIQKPGRDPEDLNHNFRASLSLPMACLKRQRAAKIKAERKNSKKFSSSLWCFFFLFFFLQPGRRCWSMDRRFILQPRTIWTNFIITHSALIWVWGGGAVTDLPQPPYVHAHTCTCKHTHADIWSCFSSSASHLPFFIHSISWKWSCSFSTTLLKFRTEKTAQCNRNGPSIPFSLWVRRLTLK